jgi:hypothetical protein
VKESSSGTETASRLWLLELTNSNGTVSGRNTKNLIEDIVRRVALLATLLIIPCIRDCINKPKTGELERGGIVSRARLEISKRCFK